MVAELTTGLQGMEQIHFDSLTIRGEGTVNQLPKPAGRALTAVVQ